MGVQDVGEVVHGEESRDHLHDDGLLAEVDTMEQVSTKLMVAQPLSLDVSSQHVVDLFQSQSLLEWKEHFLVVLAKFYLSPSRLQCRTSNRYCPSCYPSSLEIFLGDP